MFYEKPSWVFNYSIRLVDYVRVCVCVSLCVWPYPRFTKIHKADRFLIIQGGWRGVLYFFFQNAHIHCPFDGNLYVSYIVKINKAINRLCGYYYYYLLDNKTPRGITQKLNIIFSRECFFLDSYLRRRNAATAKLGDLIWFRVIYSVQYVPRHHHHEVHDVPHIPEVGVLVEDEAHRHYLGAHLHGEYSLGTKL